MKGSPTLRQLGLLAGVSRTAVSLALRNHPSISLATRQRIQSLAEAEGYTLDPVVSQVMNQLRIRRADRAAEKIAFLTSWEKRDEWLTNSYNDRNYYQGACERAAKLGYEIDVFWAKEPGMSARRLSKILHTRSIRGVIIPPLLRPHGHFSLDWEHFSAVTLSHTLFKPVLHRVAHFHFEGMLLALRCLRHYGYRRIGYANLLDQDARSNQGWLAAYLAFQHSHEAKDRVDPFLAATWRPERFSQWLKANRVEAIVSNWPAVLEAPEKLGYQVPSDLGVASLDVRLDGSRAFAGIDQQPKVQGRIAVDVVVEDLQRNEFGLPVYPKTTQLNGVWIDGPTISKLNGAKPLTAAKLERVQAAFASH